MATLVRHTGDFDLAEEAVQEAFVAALATWQEKPPRNPGAWLTTTARHKALDLLRRSANLARKHDELAHALGSAVPAVDGEEAGEMADDRLSLVFTCCHPALSLEAQVALTLKAVGGLTTVEIAHAFLVGEKAMAQRVVRAKRKIRDAGIPFRVPTRGALPQRLEGVLAVLYLVFNEGYTATAGEALVRADLCSEAIRLAANLADLMPGEPEVLGLLALMQFHHSRRHGRQAHGRLVLLEDQDRSLWDEKAIASATAVLDGALAAGRPGVYPIQATIAALHCRAPHPDATDWLQISLLYGELYRRLPTPVVALNRAAAHAMADGPEVGLGMMEGLAGDLAGYHPFHVARGRLLERCGRAAEAAEAYRAALVLIDNNVERRFVEDRLEAVASSQ